MAKTKAKLTCCMVTQALDPAYWMWTDTELDDIRHARDTGDLQPMMTRIQARLNVNGIRVAEQHGILHDHDVQKTWDPDALNYVETPKLIHVHDCIRFEKDFGGTVDQIADAIGLAPQYIEKPARGRYAWDNMLAYLIHIKYDDKFQYDANKVLSFVKPGDKTYQQIFTERREDWLKGRGKVKQKQASENIDSMIEDILTGKLTREQVLLTDDLYTVYARYTRRCEDAFETYGQRRAYKTLQAMKNGNIKMAVFYIQGPPGSGKTRLAKQFVANLVKMSGQYDERWRVCQTAATNPMDDYRGEEVLLMDDMRGSALSASDWLKLLDPFNTSPASARFHNRTPACRCIVITSSKDPLDFFYYCRNLGGGDRSEAMDQFMRRIQATVRVFRADDFSDPNYRIADMKKTDPYLVDTNQTDHRKAVMLTYKAVDDGKDYTADEAVQKMTDIVMDNNNFQHDDHSDLGTEKIHYPNGWDAWVKDYLDESKPLNNLDWLKTCAMRNNMTEDDFNRAVAKLEK